MKINKKKIITAVAALFLVFSLVSCANARWASNVGVDVVWGPHGPKVVPNVSVDLYNGGSLHH